MSPTGVPDHVLQFIAERIDSVPQLEALLLLWEKPAQAWAQGEVAARIYVEPAVAGTILQALQRRQLVTSDGAQPPGYRYSDAWDTTGTLMNQVAAAYRHHLIPVATFIHSGANSSVREFARAFDLKKDR
jgi:hypothetical protein